MISGEQGGAFRSYEEEIKHLQLRAEEEKLVCFYMLKNGKATRRKEEEAGCGKPSPLLELSSDTKVPLLLM